MLSVEKVWNWKNYKYFISSHIKNLEYIYSYMTISVSLYLWYKNRNIKLKLQVLQSIGGGTWSLTYYLREEDKHR